MLNALRHQRFGTSVLTGFFVNLEPACSTPYGIRGLALLERSQRHGAAKCSTPYGIRGLALAIGVLMALGVGCSTPYGIRGLAPTRRIWKPRTLKSAQRLTASEVWHNPTALATLALTCAQRLTASEVWHSLRFLLPCEVDSAQRLTASEVWHHPVTIPGNNSTMCSTPYGIRGLALPRGALSFKPATCSTPYGIRGLAPTKF